MAQAIERWASDASLPDLQGAVKDPRPEVQQAATAAIERLRAGK